MGDAPLLRSGRYALHAIAALLAALTAACFIESYRQLIEWAARHGQTAPWVWAWPGMLDGFTVFGELCLFAAVVKRWPRRAMVLGAALAAAGFAASLAANIGYLPHADAASRATAAAAPAGAAAALCAALLLLEFQVRDAEAAGERAQRAAERRERRAAAPPQPLHLVPAARRDDGPEGTAARRYVSAHLQRTGELPSARETGREAKVGGVPVGARLAARVLAGYVPGEEEGDTPQTGLIGAKQV